MTEDTTARPTGDDYDSGLAEKPLEFITSIANSGGSCDGQAVIPEGDHYICWCSCGEWAMDVATQAEGLRQARIHTGSRPGVEAR